MELPHAAKQTYCLPFFNFISGPPAWKQNGQKFAKVACIANCSKLVPKDQCFLTKYLGEGINLWLFRNSVTLLCPVSAGCVYSVSHKIKQNSVVFGWQYSASLAAAQPSPPRPRVQCHCKLKYFHLALHVQQWSQQLVFANIIDTETEKW